MQTHHPPLPHILATAFATAFAVIAAVIAPACSGPFDAPPPPTGTVVLVEVPGATGSGVAIDPRHILTDAHVVWPFLEATVHLPDGSTSPATVLGFDRFVDLAVLELPASLPTAQPLLIAGEPQPGEPVTHLGYVAADTPTDPADTTAATDGSPRLLTERHGLLLQQRTIGDFDVTLIETDAPAIVGMSGGALVDQSGHLLGITQFSLTPGRTFALAAADAVRHADAIIEQARTSDAPVGYRLEPAEPAEPTGAASLDFTLSGQHAHVAYLATGDQPFDLAVTAQTADQLTIAILDAHGHVSSNAVQSGVGNLAVTHTATTPGARILVARLASDGSAELHVDSGVPLQRLLDEDHTPAVVPDTPILATLDYPSDIDYFILELPAYATVLARVTSLTFDPTLQVELATAAGPLIIAADKDGGGGLLGTDTLLQFTAPLDAFYRFTISDQGTGLGHAGGYSLLVSSPFLDPH